ncbi:MAG: hypothetical protein A2X34_08350 [Elusimicrobia bacterium GWC2_51_8]|nr:MAG: hypothetical protein A2X33_02520 [Elusimicrobia bacterium GWA2_51_34]OGR59357.1 MAG: hypothetical protein A2X34_08350 [Elusimicrobia bacterium GWC2_51_8]OGR86987.1 MAG: hypothetical protein A2021_01490 [Elusimicrobia bacterium GWF2_52_66]HAF96560.1 hypothetical protein [Elusimicrobiota bacterium]HCE98214.1 hypothetical protein [Elusimicrobiota bacterium]
MGIRTKYRFMVKRPNLHGSRLYRDISSMEPKAVGPVVPLTWKKAVDFSVYDDKGNKYIDLTSGIFVANAGHSNPHIKRALKKQIDSDQMFSYNYPTRIKQQFLRKLLAISPAYFDRVDLLMTGSEAVDVAYKLMKLWASKHKRRYIITFKGSYHGRGLSNDQICGSPTKADWSGVKDKDVKFLEFPYEATEKFDPSRLPPPDQIAAFMLETFQGWGAWFYPPGYINKLYAFAKKADALVCFDEMQSGFYRLGPVYGYMTYGREIQPDIICVGKGISSSLPVAAVITRKEIAEMDPSADLHGTHSGNPLCCAAALANLEFLSSPAQLAKMKAASKVFEAEISALAGLPGVKRINARGMIAALIFDSADRATAVVNECIRNGVLPVCTRKNSVKLAPPLTMPPQVIREAAGVLRDAVVKCEGT